MNKGKEIHKGKNGLAPSCKNGSVIIMARFQVLIISIVIRARKKERKLNHVANPIVIIQVNVINSIWVELRL